MIALISFVAAIIGILISWYAYHIEQYAGKKKGYTAACDINERISCTKNITSGYGKTFGISNSVYGLIFYFVVLVLAYLGETQYIFILGVAALIASFYLAYIQYFRVRSFCLVCTASYLINIVILASTYFALF